MYNNYYVGEEWGATFTKDESTQLWMIPESDPFKVPSVTEEDFQKGPKSYDPNLNMERKEEWSDFYSTDDYVKDETTNLMMAPTTEEACKHNTALSVKLEESRPALEEKI